LGGAGVGGVILDLRFWDFSSSSSLLQRAQHGQEGFWVGIVVQKRK
jgi:hypothetical protein